MIKVLFVYYYNKDDLVNNYESNLLGSFLSEFDNNPYYQYKVLHIGYQQNDISTCEKLDYCLLNESFDIAIVTEHNEIQVGIETAKTLKKKLFICNWDTFIEKSTGWRHEDFLLYLNGFHINNFSDTEKKYSLKDLSDHCNILSFDYGIDEFLPNIYGFMCPQDTRIFTKSNDNERPYDVLFNGNVHMLERVEIVNQIFDAGIDIKVTGGYANPLMALPHNLYAAQFRKSKISLSFNESMFFKIQRKGRITEILASGSMCMMTWPSVLSYFSKKWMEDGVHYVSFNKDDCLDKIKYYLENSNERIRISEAGYNYFQQEFSPKVFWNKVFRIAGVS